MKLLLSLVFASILAVSWAYTVPKDFWHKFQENIAEQNSKAEAGDGGVAISEGEASSGSGPGLTISARFTPCGHSDEDIFGSGRRRDVQKTTSPCAAFEA